MPIRGIGSDPPGRYAVGNGQPTIVAAMTRGRQPGTSRPRRASGETGPPSTVAGCAWFGDPYGGTSMESERLIPLALATDPALAAFFLGRLATLLARQATASP